MGKRFFLLFTLLVLGSPAMAEPRHGISMLGEPLLPVNFDHLAYANPNAPKGGRITFGVQGSFDTLNPFVIRGAAPQGARPYLFETLMVRHYNEPFALYGLIAKGVEMSEDRSHVTFHLDERARFSDGVPVTSADVLFSFNLLKDKGRPNHRTFFAKVARAEAPDAQTVAFDLTGANDWELPLILGLMPVLPRHAINSETFDQTSLTPLPGSGPYLVAEVKAGESLLLKRNPNYWGKDLPFNKGLFNADELKFDFYRDSNSLFEAFRKGLVDFRLELDPTQWRSAYDFAAVRDGRVLLERVTTKAPKGFTAFAFNTRRAVFADKRVRQAITLLFDFDWLNKTYYGGLYRRTGSIFSGSELSALGRKAGTGERELLDAAGASLPQAVLDGLLAPPASDGSGQDRRRLREALSLLEEAGYALQNGILKGKVNGLPLGFEILVTTREQERLALALATFVKKAGVQAEVRIVDPAQYDRRLREFDFDMIQNTWWNTSLSPGNEQFVYWGTLAGKTPGGRNYAGLNDPAIDRLIERLVSSRTPAAMQDAARALDRTVLASSDFLPLYYLPEQWIARWKRLGVPAESSAFGYLPETWWVDSRSQAGR